MSSILKALKKLEDSKTARPPGSLHIDADILRNETPRRLSLPGILLVSALLFICGSGATYLYMKQAVSSPSGRPPVPAGAEPAVNQPPPQPLAGAPPPPSPAAAAPLQHGPSRPPVPSTPAKPTTASPAVTAAPAAKRPAEAVIHTAPPPDIPTSAPAVTAPTVKVNGIAFQGDGSGSVAVVNGVPVVTGSMIEGARVEDIQKDRVRFSYGGEKFEVDLGKSNR